MATTETNVASTLSPEEQEEEEKRERIRNRVIDEILSTEKDYADDLGILVKVLFDLCTYTHPLTLVQTNVSCVK